jgi:hypothetical protein
MVEWTVRVVRIRTTHDGGGRECGVVMGMGATGELALAELRREGEALGQRLAQEAAEAFEANEARIRAAEEDRREREAARGHHTIPIEAWRRQQAPRWAGRLAKWPRYWWFEVTDVRLTPALMEGGGSGWQAYGTLAQVDQPEQAHASGPAPGPYSDIPGVPEPPGR